MHCLHIIYKISFIVLNIFLSFLIVALKRRKRDLQLQKCDNKENISTNALNKQRDSTEITSDTSTAVPMGEQKDLKVSSNKSSEVSASQKKSRANTEKRPPNQIRYSSGNHTPETGDKRVRCKMEGCRYKSNVKCVECNVHLCINNRNCFNNFHEL